MERLLPELDTGYRRLHCVCVDMEGDREDCLKGCNEKTGGIETLV